MCSSRSYWCVIGIECLHLILILHKNTHIRNEVGRQLRQARLVQARWLFKLHVCWLTPFSKSGFLELFKGDFMDIFLDDLRVCLKACNRGGRLFIGAHLLLKFLQFLVLGSLINILSVALAPRSALGIRLVNSAQQHQLRIDCSGSGCFCRYLLPRAYTSKIETAQCIL